MHYMILFNNKPYIKCKGMKQAIKRGELYKFLNPHHQISVARIICNDMKEICSLDILFYI